MSVAVPGSWEDAVRWLLSQPDSQQVVFDCYYDRPPLAAANRYCQSAEWQSVRLLLPEAAATAVDLGSGHGITAIALARAGLSVTAVEPDPSDLVGRGAILALAAAANVSVTVCAGTAESIPAASSSFDFAIARQVLHHARDLEGACREVYRVVRPGGAFIALRDHVVSDAADLPTFLESHPLHRLYGGENAFTLTAYLGAMRAAGFVVERVLRSFDSVINFAPHSRESLREAFVARAARAPFGRMLFGRLLASEKRFDRFLSMMSGIDRRPGRLVSFFCRKPKASYGA